MDESEHQKKSAEEDPPEASENASSSSERETIDTAVDATEGINVVEAHAEGLVDEDPDRSLEEAPERRERTAGSADAPGAYASPLSPSIPEEELAAAGASTAEIQLRLRELERLEKQDKLHAEYELEKRRQIADLEMRQQDADLEAHRQEVQAEARRQEAELEARRQEAEAEARKAEAAQRRERQKQSFELRKNTWSTEKMRGLVSLLLVLGFLITTGVVIFLNATGQVQSDLLQTVASLYSGITGAVLGFSFGRQQQ